MAPVLPGESVAGSGYGRHQDGLAQIPVCGRHLLTHVMAQFPEILSRVFLLPLSRLCAFLLPSAQSNLMDPTRTRLGQYPDSGIPVAWVRIIYKIVLNCH